MNKTVAILVLLATAILPAQNTCRWHWFPVNTNLQSGFSFYFENAPASQATVSLWGTRADKAFEITKTIGTDIVHSDDHGFIPFDIVNLDKLKVKSISVSMDGKTETIKDPHSAVYYQF